MRECVCSVGFVFLDPSLTSAPQKDARLAATFYTRTREQDVQIGVLVSNSVTMTTCW